MDGYWFTSGLFTVEPGEDEETNPGRYGRQLAIWLKAQLEQHGYSVEPIIAEDWGRCLMLSRSPFLLWVGCGNVDGSADEELSKNTTLGTAFQQLRFRSSNASSASQTQVPRSQS